MDWGWSIISVNDRRGHSKHGKQRQSSLCSRQIKNESSLLSGRQIKNESSLLQVFQI